MRRVILSLLVLAAALGVVEAVPFQTIGMLRTPDAYVLPNKAAEAQFTSYLRKIGEGADIEYIPIGMLNVGILNRAELGFLYGDDVYFFNVKLKVIEETMGVPQVSIGVDNIFSPIREDARQIPLGEDFFDHPDKYLYERNSPYIVFSKQSVLRGFFGIPAISTILNAGWGQNRFKGQIPRSKRLNGLFTSVEFAPVANMAILGEFDGHELNMGLKYSYRNFSAKIGYQAIEDLFKDYATGANKRFAFSVSYLFDKYADARRRPSLPIEGGLPGQQATAVEQVISPQQPGIQSSTDQILEELRRIRESREQAQKVLEELRRELLELEREAARQ